MYLLLFVNNRSCQLGSTEYWTLVIWWMNVHGLVKANIRWFNCYIIQFCACFSFHCCGSLHEKELFTHSCCEVSLFWMHPNKPFVLGCLCFSSCWWWHSVHPQPSATTERRHGTAGQTRLCGCPPPRSVHGITCSAVQGNRESWGFPPNFVISFLHLFYVLASQVYFLFFPVLIVTCGCVEEANHQGFRNYRKLPSHTYVESATVVYFLGAQKVVVTLCRSSS